MRDRYRDATGLLVAVQKDDKPIQPPAKPIRTDADAPGEGDALDTYEALNHATEKQSFFSRFGFKSGSINDALQNSRGHNRRPEPLPDMGIEEPPTTADDLALRRARNVRSQKMIVPEGVIINGSLSSGTETEISGRVDGDVNVEGMLFLGPSALISGNVRAATCRVEGLVEGKVECTSDLELTSTGRLNADALAAKRITVAGQVLGNVMTGGILKLEKTAKVTGDIRARRFVMDEGAILNGSCAMRAQNQGAASSVNSSGSAKESE
jgi:cytoskeletal protein CcmA (bactofilin family)